MKSFRRDIVECVIRICLALLIFANGFAPGTVSARAIQTATLTPTATKLPNPTATSTITDTPTTTPVGTVANTDTPPPSATPSASVSPSSTPVVTDTSAATGTSTPTAATATASATSTATMMPTDIPAGEQFIVGTQGGTISAMNGRIKIVFPASVLSEDTQITIGAPSGSALPAYSYSGQPFQITAHEVQSNVDVHQFAQAITIQVRLADFGLANADANDLYVDWYDPSAKIWVGLPSKVDPATGTITATTNHFSVFDVNLNDWEAKLLPTVDNFQVSGFTGAGTFSYPITLPAGPGGFKPDVTLSYNSQVADQATMNAEASWVGMGWSLDTGSILEDRHGSSNANQHSWLLNVAGVSTRVVMDPNGYYHATDENFWKIEFTGGQWIVWDKQGNIYYFATNASYVASDGSHAKYEWFLTTVKNIYGQQLNYTYTQETMTVNGSPTDVTATYPQYITYDNNRYRVRFVLQGRNDYYPDFQQIGKHTVFDRSRLQTIYVEQDTQGTGNYAPIRHYDLVYAGDTSSQGVFPGYYYPAGTGKPAAVTATLMSIQMTGDASATLPAYTFTYDGLHLTQANNGQGGTVTFNYESQPWFATQGRESLTVDYNDPYANQFSYCGGGNWQLDGGSSGSFHCNQPTSLVAYGGTKVVDSAAMDFDGPSRLRLIRPGGVYRLTLNTNTQTGISIQVGLKYDDSNESALQNYQSGGNIFYLPSTAGRAMPVIQATGPTNKWGQVSNIRYELLTSVYRVTSKTLDDGRGHTYTFGYSYQNPAVNSNTSSPGDSACSPTNTQCYFQMASEFRGHGSVTESGPDGRQTTTTYNQDDVLKGRPNKVVVKDANGNILTRTLYTYFSNTLPIGQPSAPSGYPDLVRSFVYVSVEEDDVYSAGIINESGQHTGIMKGFAYDSYGNLTSETDSYLNGNLYRTTATDHFPSDTVDANGNGHYLVGFPARMQVKDASNNVMSETLNLYDGNSTYNTAPTTGILAAVRTLVSGSQYNQVSYGYDSYGNRTSVITYTGYGTASSVPGTGAETTNTAYDSKFHALPVSTTNALNQTTSYYYGDSTDPTYVSDQPSVGYLFGMPQGMKDANGALAWVRYDSFGRMFELHRPLDASSSTPSLKMCYGDGDINSKCGLSLIPFTTSITEQVDATNTYTITRQYDGMGRNFYTNTGGIITTKSFDAYGRVASQSKPYQGSEIVYYTTTTYDVLGRPLTVTAPDGTVTSSSYNGLSTTLTEPDSNGGTHSTTTTKDVWGRLASITPPTGPNVSYQYDALDRLTSATRGGVTSSMGYDAAGRKTSMSDPDMGNWTYQYDGIGNLSSQSDAKGQVDCMYYDTLNRLTGKYYTTSLPCPPSPTYAVAYNYDEGGASAYAFGHRTSMVTKDSTGNTLWSNAWTYDARGRVTSEMAQTFTTSWTYNNADQPITMTYPDNETVTFHHNSLMQLDSVIGTNPYAQSISYDSANRVTSIALGNGLTQKFPYYTWDGRDNNNVQHPGSGGRLEFMIAGSGTWDGNALLFSNTIQKLNYNYDSVGNVSSIYDSMWGETQAFWYDSLNRLTGASATHGLADYNETGANGYSYNPTTGNLVGKGGVTLQYNDAAHVHAATNAGSNTYTYDSNGNQATRTIGGNTYTLNYDAENRLVSVSGNSINASFVYDGDGKRVQSTIGTTTTTFIGNYYENTNGVVTKYYYAGATRLAMRSNGTLDYMLGDHLGSTSITADASGSIVSQLRYDAWGKIRLSLDGNGNPQTPGPSKYTYTGQYSNMSEFGLMFYNARWYDPYLARFAQADTVVPRGVQGYDRYAYVNNSPINNSDPSGHKPCWATVVYSCDLTQEQINDLLNGSDSNKKFATNYLAQFGQTKLLGSFNPDYQPMLIGDRAPDIYEGTEYDLLQSLRDIGLDERVPAPTVFVYVNYIQGPNGSRSVTGITVVNQSGYDLSISFVRFSAGYSPLFRSICDSCLPPNQTYNAAPPKLDESPYLGKVDHGDAGVISLIPSGNLSNPNNQFSPAIFQNVSIRVYFVYTGGLNFVMGNLFP